MRKISVADPVIGEDELRLVTEAVKSGWVSSAGKYIPLFEKNFAKFCGAEHGVAVSNGTVALHLALVSLGIGRQDEVIVPTLSYIATANAVSYTGAKPVFVDSEEPTWNIDPAKIEEKITERTRAIIAVHLYGHPADMDRILKIAKKHKLFVVEDAAEAHGALYKDKPVGSLGDVACFSFYGNKIVTTGEGGMLLTDDKRLAERMRFLRNQAQSPSKRYWHGEVGFNYRMTNLQAALGVAQTRKIKNTITKKRKIARLYAKYLSDLNLVLHPEARWARNVYWMYSVLVRGGKTRRDRVMERLAREGIETRPFFYAIHTLPPYRQKGDYGVAERLSNQGINLPSSPRLTQEDIEYIAQTLKEVLKHA